MWGLSGHNFDVCIAFLHFIYLRLILTQLCPQFPPLLLHKGYLQTKAGRKINSLSMCLFRSLLPCLYTQRPAVSTTAPASPPHPPGGPSHLPEGWRSAPPAGGSPAAGLPATPAHRSTPAGSHRSRPEQTDRHTHTMRGKFKANENLHCSFEITSMVKENKYKAEINTKSLTLKQTDQ